MTLNPSTAQRMLRDLVAHVSGPTGPTSPLLVPLDHLAQVVLIRRTWQGLTSRDLAAKISVSPSTITRVEQGRPPSAEIYRRLCLWLAEPPGDFHSKKESRQGHRDRA